MIVSFSDTTTEDVFHGTNSKKARQFPKELHGKACRSLDMLNASIHIEDLRIPPSNRLEKLEGKEDVWSIQINGQYRVEFKWDGKDAHDVRIWDYH